MRGGTAGPRRAAAAAAEAPLGAAVPSPDAAARLFDMMNGGRADAAYCDEPAAPSGGGVVYGDPMAPARAVAYGGVPLAMLGWGAP